MIEHSTDTHTFDLINDVYTFIGDGRYQILVILVCCLASIPVGIQNLILYFIAFDPGWRCAETSSSCPYNTTIHNGDPLYKARCHMNRSDWTFAASDKFSIVTEFDLFCDREHWIETTYTVFNIGNLLGAPILGWMADRFGRSKVVFVCFSSVVLTSLVSAFVKQLWLFEVLRFVCGVMEGGTIMIMITLCSEITGKGYRAAAGQIQWFFYSSGIALSGLIAFKFQEWRHIMILVTAPFTILIIFLWFVPDTFAWLHDNNKEKAFEKEIRRIIKFNNRPNVSKKIQVKPKSIREDEKSGVMLQLRMLFSSRKLVMITLCASLGWFTLGLVFFGISLVADNLTGDAYRDFVLLALTDLPASFLAISTSSRCGRKVSTILSIFTSSLCIVIIGFIPSSSSKSSPHSIARLSLGISAKLLITTAYDVMIVWCLELFPTKLRSTASGYFNAISIIGATFAPWVGIWLRKINESLPFFIMGGCGIISSLLLIWLSETKGTHLPDDIESDKVIGETRAQKGIENNGLD